MKTRHLVDMLEARADEHPGRLALTFLETGEVTGPCRTLTYGHLARRARGQASRLTAEGWGPGDRALLLYPAGPEFVEAFFGCIYAGVVAVPVWPPNPRHLERSLATLAGILRDCEPKGVLTTGALQGLAAGIGSRVPGLAGTPLVATDGATTDGAWTPPAIDAETLAFLQYTSGSTGSPKGVRMTHRNLLANQAMICAAGRTGPGLRGVGWLPLYHDMGLIGHVLHPLCLGGSLAFLSPLHFLERPMRWLEAMSHFRAEAGGGPDFAYALCARKATGADLSGLDLSSWRTAFVGAEPVRAETLETFARVFGPCGFAAKSLFPCYGLAEATLIVTGAHLDAGVHRHPLPGGRSAVGCGPPVPGVELRITTPGDGAPLPDGAEGEILVRGPSVSAGYWGRPPEDPETFIPDPAGAWLRTGDLGTLVDGQLHVTGRIKDLIVIRGRNLYPQDLERAGEAACPQLRPGGSAAFAVADEAEGEGLGFVAEVRREVPAEALAALSVAIRVALTAAAEAGPRVVALLPQGELPKTSSGKVRRREAGQAVADGSLPVLHLWTLPPATAQPLPEAAVIEAGRRLLARQAGIDLAAVTLDRPLDELGLDSVARVELLDALRGLTGRPLPARRAAEATCLAELLAVEEAAESATESAAEGAVEGTVGAPAAEGTVGAPAAAAPVGVAGGGGLPDPAWMAELEDSEW